MPLTDEEILEEVNIEEIEADDDLDDEFDVEVTIPNIRKVEETLKNLHNFSVFSLKRGQIMQNLVLQFQRFLGLVRLTEAIVDFEFL